MEAPAAAFSGSVSGAHTVTYHEEDASSPCAAPGVFTGANATAQLKRLARWVSDPPRKERRFPHPGRSVRGRSETRRAMFSCGARCWLLMALALLPLGCKKPEAPPPKAPPEVLVAAGGPARRAHLPALDRHPRRRGQRADSGPGLRLPPDAGLPRRRLRPQGRPDLFQIDPRPLQAALDQAKGRLAQSEANLGKTEMDVQPVHAAGRQGRRQPRGPR